MPKKSLNLITDIAGIAALGLAGVALFKIIKRILSHDLGTGTKDKPIIVSGGSLYLSSRAMFTNSAGQLTVNMGSYSVTGFEISVNGSNPAIYTPTSGAAWVLTLTGTASTLTVQSDGSSLVTFSGMASDFTDVMSGYYFGTVKKHNQITTVSNISLTGADMNLSQPVGGIQYYVLMHYDQ